MLNEEGESKTKDFLYNAHLNFLGRFQREKTFALYTSKYGTDLDTNIWMVLKTFRAL